MEAKICKINDLFNGNRFLEVPFFQRHYVWNEENWQRFLEDMESVSFSNQTYFFGSIILKQKEDNNRDIKILIDGQQRLTTLCIFFKVLYLKMGENAAFERNFLTTNRDKPFTLEHNYIDKKYFEQILALEELKRFDSKENRIFELYEFFCENISTEDINNQVYSHQKIKNHLSFVTIDLSKEDDEQQIFDSINSLGVRLTTADLLKNYLFSNENAIDAFQEYWQSVFDNDEQKAYWEQSVTHNGRAMIDFFLYSFLQVKIQDYNISSPDKQSYAKVDKLFLSYKDFIQKQKIDVPSLLEEMRKCAKVFYDSFEPNIDNTTLPYNNYLKRVNLIIFTLGYTFLIPYVLYVQLKVSDPHQRNEIFRLLESFIMHRVMLQKTSKGLDLFVIHQLIAKGISTADQLSNHLQRDGGYLEIPKYKEFEASFHQQKLTNIRAKIALYLLELSHPNRKLSVLPSFNKFNIDFLMPKKWELHWEKSLNPEWRKSKITTLGNITLLPITRQLPPTVRDANWENKKIGAGRIQGLKYYAPYITTLEPYINLSYWNEQTIEKRANDLYQLALQTWKSN